MTTAVATDEGPSQGLNVTRTPPSLSIHHPGGVWGGDFRNKLIGEMRLPSYSRRRSTIPGVEEELMGTAELIAKIESLPEQKREDLLTLVNTMASPPADPFIARVRERREQLKAQFGYFGTAEILRDLRDEGR